MTKGDIPIPGNSINYTKYIHIMLYISNIIDLYHVIINIFGIGVYLFDVIVLDSGFIFVNNIVTDVICIPRDYFLHLSLQMFTS